MEEELGVDAKIYSPRHPKNLPKNSRLNTTKSVSESSESSNEANIRNAVNKVISATCDEAKTSIISLYGTLRDRIKEVKQKRKEKKEEKSKEIDLQSSTCDLKKLSPEYETFIDEEKPLAYPIISATILSIPYAFREAGFPLGLIMLIVIAIMVDYSEVLLIQCSVLADDVSLQRIAKSTFGVPGSIASYAMPYLFSVSVLVTYNIIIADTFTKFLNELFQILSVTTVADRRVVLFILTFFIIPLSLSTNVKRIFRWSLVSLVATTFVMILVSVRWITLSASAPVASEKCKFLNINVLQAFGVMTFAISCQHTCRLYYATIERTRDTSGNRPANVASSYSLLCTVILGVFGYLTFKSTTRTNILDNYCDDDLFAMAGRFLVTLFAMSLFPLECENMRHLLKQLIVVHKQFERGMNFVITLLVLSPPLLIAFLVDCLPFMLSMPGLLLAVPLVFLVPPIIFLKLSPGDITSTKKLPCLVCIAVGSTASICGLTMEVFHHQSTCVKQSKPMSHCNSTDDLLGPQITLTALNDTFTRYQNITEW